MNEYGAPGNKMDDDSSGTEKKGDQVIVSREEEDK